MIAEPAPKASLGTRMIGGMNSEGEKSTTTIQAGAIGSGRPISPVTERWYSSELQVNRMTSKTDPRTGEETFKLTNMGRAEPDASLLQVPSGCQPAGQPSCRLAPF